MFLLQLHLWRFIHVGEPSGLFQEVMITMVMKHVLAKWPDAFVGSQPHHELYGFAISDLSVSDLICKYHFHLNLPAWMMDESKAICCPAEFTIPKPNVFKCSSSDIGAHKGRITKHNSFRFCCLRVSNVSLGTTPCVHQEVHQCWLHATVTGQGPLSSSKE